MSKTLIKHRLKRELRSRGVRVNRLLLDISDDRIIISGEVGTFYEVQLIQIYATTVGDGREIVNNLSVVPTLYDLAHQTPPKSENQSEVHRLRNRLNEASLAMRVLEKVLIKDDITQAKTIVTEMLRSMDSAESEDRQDDSGLSRLRILVVEDDTHQCLLLTGLLRHLGADVAHACDSDSAFRALNEGFTPDVVLLDMHLPVENGATIARSIRHRHHCEHARIIAVSGTHPKELGLSFDEGEVDAWVPKPVNVERLLKAVCNEARTAG